MTEIMTGDFAENNRLNSLGVLGTDATWFEAWTAAAGDTMATNPLTTGTGWLKRRAYENGFVDENNELTFTGGRGPRLLSPDVANERFGVEGQLSFDSVVDEAVAADLYRRKLGEMRAADIIQRSSLGTFGMISAGLVASALDPLNIASGFLPVVGEARFAWLAGRLGKTGARATTGIIEGAVGAAAVEPIVLLGTADEQRDYDAYDSLVNIAFGSALSGGLHLGAGAIRDRALRTLDTTPLQNLAEGLSEADKASVLGTAVSQVEQGVPVDIKPVLDAAVEARRVDKAAFQQQVEAAFRDLDARAAEVQKSAPELTPGATANERLRQIEAAISTELDPEIAAQLGFEAERLRPIASRRSELNSQLRDVQSGLADARAITDPVRTQLDEVRAAIKAEAEAAGVKGSKTVSEANDRAFERALELSEALKDPELTAAQARDLSLEAEGIAQFLEAAPKLRAKALKLEQTAKEARQQVETMLGEKSAKIREIMGETKKVVEGRKRLDPQQQASVERANISAQRAQSEPPAPDSSRPVSEVEKLKAEAEAEIAAVQALFGKDEVGTAQFKREAAAIDKNAQIAAKAWETAATCGVRRS